MSMTVKQRSLSYKSTVRSPMYTSLYKHLPTSTTDRRRAMCSKRNWQGVKIAREEKHANGARGKPLRKLRKWRVADKPARELTSRWRTFSRQNIQYRWAHGTWVHCTKRETKLQQLLRKMTNYKMEILCVSVARWTDSGRQLLALGHTIFYYGRTDYLHKGGVVFIVTRKVEKTLLEWKPVNDRMMKVRFN